MHTRKTIMLTLFMKTKSLSLISLLTLTEHNK